MKDYKEFSQFWIILSIGYLLDVITTSYGLYIGLIEGNKFNNPLLGLPIIFIIGFIFYNIGYKLIGKKQIINIMPYLFTLGFVTWIAPIINIYTIMKYLGLIH